MGIDINFGTILYHIMNVYMPFDCNENMNDFIYHSYKIDAVFKNNHTVHNMAIGDFNSDLLGSSMFGRELCKFCDEKCYTIGDQKHLPENMFTCHSDAHDSVSWLDHAICSTAMFNKITSMNVLYSYLTSDHFVLSVTLDNVINEIPPDLYNDSDDTFNIKRVHWDRLSCDTLSKYTDLPDLLLHDPDFVCNAVYCSGGENCSEQHKQDLILLYEKLTRAMKTAGEMTFPESAKGNITPVPRWKELLETPDNEARNAYLVWRSTNRPRSGSVHEWMKRTRARFKYAQKVVKRNEDTFCADAMAAKFDTGDIKGFWKCVKDYDTGP